MTDTAILHIPELDKPLNKKQKEFNTLSNTIEALDRQIADLQNAYDEMLRRIPCPTSTRSYVSTRVTGQIL